MTYKWNICADLKVTALLLGLQLGYTKFPCFPCEWDSRDKALHFVKGICSARKILEPGHRNVKHHLLVESWEDFVAGSSYQIRPHEEFCEGYGS